MNVNPTRMELSKLKRKLKTSKEGHRLLKDKQDELMRIFIDLINETNPLRLEVNRKIREFSIKAGLSASGFQPQMLDNLFFAQETLISADIDTKNLMGVQVASIKFDVLEPKPSSVLISTPALTQTENDMTELLPLLLKLTENEKNCVILSTEIEKLRRRVNALEYMIIPDIEANIKRIRMKLDDAERDNTTRLIKIKNISNN